MSDLTSIGKLIMVVGVAIVVFGAIVLLAGRFITGGRPLPGDLLIKRDNVTIYIPIATSIAVSLVLTLVLWLVSRLRR